MTQRVLVIGATGLLGEPVARGLMGAGVAVRVMSREASRLRAKFCEGFEVAVGDAMNRTDLDRALQGCDAVHLSIDHEREAECVDLAVEVAKAQGFRRLSYVSGTTVCEENGWFPLVRRKLRAERAVTGSGIEYAIFRPGWFMEMLSRFVRGGKAIVFGRPERRWHFVAAGEFARMVVASYQRPEAANRCYYVHGPQALTVEEAVQEYCRALHTEIRAVRRMPYWLLRPVARIGGNAEMRAGLEMVSYLEQVGERGDPTEANAILGAPQVTLERWLKMRKEGRC